MGKRTDYDLRGWGPNGRFLSAFEKEEIQDLVFDEGMDDYGCSSRDNEPEIMSFGSEYYGAYEDVRKALSGYAHRNPEVLLELKYDCDDDDEHLIVSARKPHTGLSRFGLERIISEISKRANHLIGKNVTPHVFRHTTATVAVQNGMPIQNVSKLLGHSQVETTMIYAEIDTLDVKRDHTRFVI